MTETLYISIPKSKAEMPAIIVILVVLSIGFAFHYGFFGWLGGLIFIAVFLPLAIFLFFRFRGEYFVQVDRNGISWRQGIFSRFINIPWNYLQRVDYLVYEINFMMKETAQVVSFATSGLTEEQTEQVKSAISDILGHQRNEAGV